MKNVKAKWKNQKAFTLIEALVAISILLIALASPMVLAQKGITAAELSKNQMTASFLAQDGIEAVKNIRDQVAISTSSDEENAQGDDWLYPLVVGGCVCTASDADCSNFASDAQWCNIDTTIQNIPQNISAAIKTGSSASQLMMTTSDGTKNGTFIKYDLSGTVPSIFSRYINVHQSTTNPDEAAINVRVSWMSSIGLQSITIKDFIYNYSENIQQSGN